MSRIVQILVFLGMAAVLLGGLHYYVFARVARDLGLSGGQRAAVGVLLGGLFALLLAAMPASRVLPRSVASPLSSRL